MTELSARKWVEMNRTDVAHLFRWVYPSQKCHQKIKKWVSVECFWVWSSWSENLEKIKIFKNVWEYFSQAGKVRNSIFGLSLA